MTFDELIRCLTLLLDHAKLLGHHQVDISQADRYWTITGSDLSGFDSVPSPAVGSYQDDVRELRRMLEGRPGSAVELDRLAEVLRLLSNQLVSD